MYAEKLLNLANKIKSDLQKEEFMDALNQCFSYTNTVMYASLEMEMGDGSIRELERLNNKRNFAHDKLCQGLNTINKIAEEKGLDKPFPFELEPVQKNGRFAGYSQNNHYITAQISAVVIDELEFLGKETYKNLDNLERLEDSIIKQATKREFKSYNFHDMMSQMNKYNEKHYQINQLLDNNLNKGIEINLRNPKGSLVISKQDDYSIEVISSDISKDCELSYYLDTDGTGTDIPISLLKETIEDHEGYDLIKTVDLETIKEESLDDIIANAENLSKESIPLNYDLKKLIGLELDDDSVEL